jgi:hypothetical protein
MEEKTGERIKSCTIITCGAMHIHPTVAEFITTMLADLKPL